MAANNLTASELIANEYSIQKQSSMRAREAALSYSALAVGNTVLLCDIVDAIQINSGADHETARFAAFSLIDEGIAKIEPDFRISL